MIFLFLYAVPYWGSLYFNQTNADRIRNMSEFPSPIGVLYISIMKKLFVSVPMKGFPSPIGVLYISMKTTNNEEKSVEKFPSPIGVLYISIYT